METKNKKQINTLIDRRLWHDAKMSKISWARALELGIELMLGNTKKLEKLREEKKALLMKIKYINGKIAEIENEQKKKEEQKEIIKKHIQLLKESAEILDRDISFLKGRTRLWNNTTRMMLSPDEFWKLIQKFKGGEFDEN